MNSRETLAFAKRLMREVWEPFDAEAVPRFYHRDVIGHHRKQLLTYDDVVHRLVTDRPRYANPRLTLRTSSPKKTNGRSGSCSRPPEPPGNPFPRR